MSRTALKDMWWVCGAVGELFRYDDLSEGYEDDPAWLAFSREDPPRAVCAVCGELLRAQADVACVRTALLNDELEPAGWVVVHAECGRVVEAVEH